jgi:NADH pyrophosphatase NudC (nudix superfamily)
VSQTGTFQIQVKSLEIRLEPCDGKLSRTVLRGGLSGDAQTLPDRIQRLCQHLDNLISRSEDAKCRQRRQMRIAGNRIRERIQALIKDLHNKAVNLLVNSYKVIYLPTFDSSQMVIKSRGGKKRRINSKSARQMLTLSHYRFEQLLLQASLRCGVLVVLCNESYTSKTCGNCGHIHYKLGGSKVFKCPPKRDSSFPRCEWRTQHHVTCFAGNCLHRDARFYCAVGFVRIDGKR